MDGHSDDNGDSLCPLCMEEMDLTDRQLRPCLCGYQICVWCWHQIVEMAEKDRTEGRCPACRTPYDKERVVSTTVSCDRMPEFSVEKKHKCTKSKSKALEDRKNLSNVRVVQRNLVYVVGVPLHLANEETLEQHEFFGRYGKILKISISKSGSHSSPTASVYVTFVKEDDAIRCIQAVNGFSLEGKALKACFGTTKYCNAWIRNMHCNNPECLYLHDECSREDTFTKEEMLAKDGSKNQCFHDITHTVQKHAGFGLPLPATESTPATIASHHPSMLPGNHTKQLMPNGSSGKQSSLPPAAHWGSRGNTGTSATPAGGKARMVCSSSSSQSTTSLSSNQAVPEAGNITLQSDLTKQILKRSKIAPVDVLPAAALRGSIAGKALDTSSESVKKTSGNIILTDVSARNAAVMLVDKIQEKPRVAESIGFWEESHQSLEIDSSTSKVSTSTVDSFETDSLQSSCRIQAAATTGTAMIPNCTLGSSQMVREPSEFCKTSQVKTNARSGTESSFSLSQDNCKHVPAPIFSNRSFTEKPSCNTKVLKSGGFLQDPNNKTADTVEDSVCSVSLSTDSINSECNPDISFIEAGAVEECDYSCLLQSGSRSREKFQAGNSVSPESSNWLKEQNVHKNGYRLEVSEHIKDTSQNNKANGNVAESDIISGMLAMGIDLWADENPHDFANILYREKSRLKPSIGMEERTHVGKSQIAKQSRFQFAREKEPSSRGSIVSEVHAENFPLASSEESVSFKDFGSTIPGHLQEDFDTLKCSSVSISASARSSAVPPSSLYTKSAFSAPPPGFHTPVRSLSGSPPGFSSQNKYDRSLDLKTSSGSIQPSVLGSLGRNDIEFIDPAIMAVGKGNLPFTLSHDPSFSRVSPRREFINHMPAQSGFGFASSLQQNQRLSDVSVNSSLQQRHLLEDFNTMNLRLPLNYSEQNSSNSAMSALHHHNNSMRDSESSRLSSLQQILYSGVPQARLSEFSGVSWGAWDRIHSNLDTSSMRLDRISDAYGQSSNSQTMLDSILQTQVREMPANKDMYFADTIFRGQHDMGLYDRTMPRYLQPR